ncbi:hypothetical protein F8568_036350 [Actinomadura sp. LD22]|uniref:Uncharacterized protein n=1 Tax=Actinomadura physcomitrii TaxID=2650748 RepID=A0A6I4MTU1_9ACTN|nr:hypothetical protein [Actinomadura physcomitrii]MWA05736.1 hypothetical protein [Actinomadura physcomitrii]
MVANLGREKPPAARRGSRRRPRRESALLWWALFAAVAVLAWYLHSWRVALLGLLGWCLYEFLLVPTLCRVLTPQGVPCIERARGRLFACSARHQRVKSDALWKLIGMRNPSRRKPDPEETDGATGVVVHSASVRGRLVPADRALILLASAGTVVTVIGMVYGFG